MSRTLRDDTIGPILRKGISQSDDIPCKDFRLCAVDVFESIYLSNDSIWDMEDNLMALEELYEQYPPEDEMMGDLMELLRKKVDKLRRGVKV